MCKYRNKITQNIKTANTDCIVFVVYYCNANVNDSIDVFIFKCLCLFICYNNFIKILRGCKIHFINPLINCLHVGAIHHIQLNVVSVVVVIGIIGVGIIGVGIIGVRIIGIRIIGGDDNGGHDNGVKILHCL
jgi:hypothetical protein